MTFEDEDRPPAPAVIIKPATTTILATEVFAHAFRCPWCLQMRERDSVSQAEAHRAQTVVCSACGTKVYLHAVSVRL